MATYKESLDALIEYQKSLSDNIAGYFDELAGVVNGITYPEIPDGDITTPGQLGWTSLNLPEISWPLSPDINYTAMANVDKYKKHIWEGPYLDQAERLLIGWATSGGVGISQAVQDAIFNQDRERRNQSLREGLDVLASRHGGAGFRYANSRLDIKQSALVQKFQFDDTQASRTIVTTIADLAQKNVQFALQQVTEIEKFQGDFSVRYSALYLDTMTHIIETYKADIASKATQADTEIRKGLAFLDAAKYSGENDYRSAELKMSAEKTRLLAEMDRAKLELGMITDEVKIKVTALEQMASTTATMLSATMNSVISVGKAT